MRSNISAVSRMPWFRKREHAGSAVSCAVTFITRRSGGSMDVSTSTTATGLKAAPPSRKMPPEIWRFSTGPLPQPRLRQASSPMQRTNSQAPFPPEVDVTPDGALAAPPALPQMLRHERVLIVTDAWAPQVNGVVRTLEILGADLEAMGHEVLYATPEGRFTLPMPTYSEIRLALFPRKSLEAMIDRFKPTAIHIATEGTLGLSARAICIKRRIPFTTSFHTRFPEYVKARFPFVPISAVYAFLRWFHGPADAMMVATPSLLEEMRGHGFTNLRIWSRGVDVDVFRPIEGATLPFAKPIWLYVGRIAVEKNLEAFLSLDLPGTKVVIGEGPVRASLERQFPDAKFLGAKTSEDLVRAYAASDVFVFPSRTDTFGLVLLEALACGVPVAAFPVQGPLDVIGDAPVGVLNENLREACLRALDIAHNKDDGANLSPRAFAMTLSWRTCTEEFLANLPA